MPDIDDNGFRTFTHRKTGSRALLVELDCDRNIIAFGRRGTTAGSSNSFLKSNSFLNNTGGRSRLEQAIFQSCIVAKAISDGPGPHKIRHIVLKALVGDGAPTDIDIDEAMLAQGVTQTCYPLADTAAVDVHLWSYVTLAPLPPRRLVLDPVPKPRHPGGAAETTPPKTPGGPIETTKPKSQGGPTGATPPKWPGGPIETTPPKTPGGSTEKK